MPKLEKTTSTVKVTEVHGEDYLNKRFYVAVTNWPNGEGCDLDIKAALDEGHRKNYHLTLTFDEVAGVLTALKAHRKGK